MKTAVNRLRGVERDIVQTPQTGDVVKVSSMNRGGYVGARRIA